jgi:hypothetical protein
MRVGAREGLAYYSVKLVLLANGNRHEVDSNTLFLKSKALYLFQVLQCTISDIFSHTFVTLGCAWINIRRLKD